MTNEHSQARSDALTRAETPVADATIRRAHDLLDEFEAASVRALLFAACSSPTARHRYATLSTLLVACLRRSPTGMRVAKASDLPFLVSALRDHDPVLAEQEDFVPLDPSLLVTDVMDPEGSMFPVHPGTLEHPQAVAREVLDRAFAVDRIAVKVTGYGCADLLEVAGSMLRAQHEALSPYWVPAPDLQIDDPISVSDAEVDAAAAFLSTFDPIAFGKQGTKRQARRRQLAAQATTADADDLAVRHNWPATTLGATLFIRSAGRCLPVPASLVMEGLAAATQALVTTLFPSDPPGDGVPTTAAGQRRAVLRRWRNIGELRLQEVLSSGVAHVVYPVRIYGQGRREFALLVTGHRHVILLDLVTGLEPTELAADVDAARLALAELPADVAIRIPRLADFTPPHRSDPVSSDRNLTWIPGLADALPFTIPADGGWTCLTEGTDVTCMVVVHGPWIEPVIRERSSPGASVVVCPLPMLKEITSEVSADERDDLWAFIDEVASFGGDMAAGTGVAAIQAFSVLDLWEVWSDRGMLAPAWSDPDTLLRTKPADTATAWCTASRRSELDWLLRAVDLPPVRSWPTISEGPLYALTASESPPPASDEPRGWTTKSRGAVTLTRMAPREAAFASVLDRTVVSVDLEFGRQAFSREFAVRFTDSLLSALQQLAAFQPDAWDIWTRAHSDRPVHVRVVPQPLSDQTVRLLGCGIGEVVVFYDPVRVDDATAVDCTTNSGRRCDTPSKSCSTLRAHKAQIARRSASTWTRSLDRRMPARPVRSSSLAGRQCRPPSTGSTSLIRSTRMCSQRQRR